MTKQKSTKRALLMSALALLMCVSMLIGSTFAWFTDSVTSGNNIVKSGNLDLKLSYKPYGADNTEWTEVDSDTVVFGEDALYEPGYTEAVWLKVENIGSLAFKYNLALNIVNEKPGTNKDGEEFKLSDYLEVKYMNTSSTDMESGFYTTRESLDSFNFGGVSNSGVATFADDIAVINNGVAFSKNDTAMAGYDSSYVLVVISMPTTVGNEANHNGVDIPEINFRLTALATQVVHEEDSFNNQYDKDATYPELADMWNGTSDAAWYKETETEFIITTAEELAGFATLVNGGNTFAGKTVKLGRDIDLSNLDWTPIGNNTNRFKGIFDGDEHVISNMAITRTDVTDSQQLGLFGTVENAVVKNLTVMDSNITATGTSTMNVGVLTGVAQFNSSNYTTEIANTFNNVTINGAKINLTSTGAVRLAGVAGYSYSVDLDAVHVSNLNLTANADGNVHGGAIFGYFSPQENGNPKDDTLNPLRNFTIANVSLEVTKGKNVYYGGLAGFSYYGHLEIDDANISNLTVDTVSNGAFVGSLFGYTNRSTVYPYEINNVTSTGIDFDVTTDYLGETRVGGMVGYLLSTANFTDCSVSGKIIERCSTGVVNHHAKAGGFVGRGYTWQQNYTNCVADVDITSSNIAGGFIGNHITGATYTDCKALGDVTANVAGGFVGRITQHTQSREATFINCIASGNVNGTTVAGGFIGSTADYGWGNATGVPFNKTVTIKDCKIDGTVTGSGAIAGIVGEAAMADGVKIVIENVDCAITPAFVPNDSCVEYVTGD